MTDKDILERSSLLLREAMGVVQKALPDTSPELIGGFFAHLLDLWETGQTLDRKLHELVTLRFPEDRAKLYDTLIWIDAIQIDMGLFWTRGIKKDVSKLLRALGKSGGKRVTKRSSQQKYRSR